MHRPSFLAAAVASTWLASAAFAQNLLVNGSFESWPGRVPPYVTLNGGSTALPGWTVTGTSVDLVGSAWQQGDATYSVDLDGSPGPGGLTQTFATTPGQWYSVSFLLAGNPQCGTAVKSIRIDAAGQSQVFSFSTAGHDFSSMGWDPRSWCFLANGRSTTLAITSLTDGSTNCGPALDAVAVEASDPPLVGDFDCSGTVDGADLAVLLGAWGPCISCLGCRTDLNGDCATDAADLALVLGSWTG